MSPCQSRPFAFHLAESVGVFAGSVDWDYVKNNWSDCCLTMINSTTPVHVIDEDHAGSGVTHNGVTHVGGLSGSGPRVTVVILGILCLLRIPHDRA